MKRFIFSWLGITIVWGVLASATNPLIGSYIMTFIEWAFTYAFKHYGSWIGLGFAVDVILYGTITSIKSSRLNIPSKTAHTQKAGNFIEK